jgi:hypothetical protein
MEWLAACDKAAAEGKAAKVESETLLDAENKDHTFKATQQIEFDWRVGLQRCRTAARSWRSNMA